MTEPDDDWMTDHQVLVETYNDDTSDGPGYAAQVTRDVGLEEKTEVARDSNGDEVTISGRLFAHLELQPDFTPQTRVRIRPGRWARVVGLEVHDAGGELAELDHLEVLFV